MEQVFTGLPIMAFRQNKNQQDILGKKTVGNSRKQPEIKLKLKLKQTEMNNRKCQNINQNGYLKPCNSNAEALSQTPSEALSRTKPFEYTMKPIAKVNTSYT